MSAARHIGGIVLVVLLGAATPGAAQVDGRLAPPEDQAATEAEAWVQNKKVGAAVLWGGMILASVIIGTVRHRQRVARRALESKDRP